MQLGALASGHAQNRISLSMQNVMLDQIINELKQQTGMDFFYSVEKLREEQKKTIEIKDGTLEDVLNNILKSTGLTFVIMNDVVVIKDKIVIPADSTSKKSVTIKGIVKDEMGNPLPGVTVLIKGTKVGVSTNAHGSFQMNMGDTTNLTLVFSFIGMETKTVAYPRNLNNTPWVITMEAQDNIMEEAVVTGYQTLKRGNVAGSISTITKDDLVITGVTSLEQMLQGKIPGSLYRPSVVLLVHGPG